ncbi:MAG: hypothetical protein K8R67_10975 [Desulfobacteraceae bacterium]|nr:hypothetical protein [Desulfobacteraceae bacterium]
MNRLLYRILIILLFLSAVNCAEEPREQTYDIKVEVRPVLQAEYGETKSFGTEVLLSNRDFIGAEVISRELSMSEKAIANALKERMKVSQEVVELRLKFTKEGQIKFAIASKQYAGKQLGYFLDGKCVVAPTIVGPIDSDIVIIGGLSKDDAQDMASVMSSLQ